MGEWNKLIRNKKMLCRLGLVLLCGVLAQIFLMYPVHEQSADTVQVREYMRQLSGKLTEEKAAFLMAENDAVIRGENDLVRLAEQYLAGEVTKDEYAREADQYKSLADKRDTFYEVWDKYSFVQEDSEHRYFLIHDRPLFFPVLDPFFLLFSVMLVSFYICEENDTGMIDLIRSAGQGHMRSARTKLLIILGMSVVYMLFKQGCKVLLFVYANGWEALTYPLQSVYLTSTSPVEYSIGRGLGVETLYKLVGAIGLASAYMILGHQTKQKEILANAGVVQFMVYGMMQNSHTFRQLPLPGNLVRGSQYLVGDISDRILLTMTDYAWIGKNAVVMAVCVSLVLAGLAYVNFRRHYRNFKSVKMLCLFLIALTLAGCGVEKPLYTDLQNQKMVQNHAFYFVENGGTIYQIDKKQGTMEKLPLSIFMEQNDYLVEALICKDDKLYVSVSYDWGDDISSIRHFDVLEMNLVTGEIRTKWQLQLFRKRILLDSVNLYHVGESDVLATFMKQDDLCIFTGEKLKQIGRWTEKTLSRHIYGTPFYTNGKVVYIHGRDFRVYALDLHTKETALAYVYPVDTFTMAGDRLIVSTQEGIGMVYSLEDVQCIAPERSNELFFDGKNLYSLELDSHQVVSMDLDGRHKKLIEGNMDLWITSWDSPYMVSKFFNASKGEWEVEILKK